MTGPTGIVLDAGAFIALERREPAMVAHVQELVRAGIPLATSAAVVAQVWRGNGPRQAPVAYLLRATHVVDLTGQVARILGRMLGRAGTADPIDAHVVLLARERGWPVLTSDPDDLRAIDAGIAVEKI